MKTVRYGSPSQVALVWAPAQEEHLCAWGRDQWEAPEGCHLVIKTGESCLGLEINEFVVHRYCERCTRLAWGIQP